MKEMWISQSGTIYSLVSFDAEAFQDSVRKMSQLSEGIRKAVDERADSAFRELDEATTQARR